MRAAANFMRGGSLVGISPGLKYTHGARVVFADRVARQNIPSWSIAASLIMLRSQGGAQTSSILALVTSGIASMRRSTSPGNEPATGQAGVVSVIRTFTDRSGCTSIA